MTEDDSRPDERRPWTRTQSPRRWSRVTLDADVAERLDRARGEQSRSAYLRRLVEADSVLIALHPDDDAVGRDGDPDHGGGRDRPSPGRGGDTRSSDPSRRDRNVFVSGPTGSRTDTDAGSEFDFDWERKTRRDGSTDGATRRPNTGGTTRRSVGRDRRDRSRRDDLRAVVPFSPLPRDTRGERDRPFDGSLGPGRYDRRRQSNGTGESVDSDPRKADVRHRDPRVSRGDTHRRDKRFHHRQTRPSERDQRREEESRSEGERVREPRPEGERDDGRQHRPASDGGPGPGRFAVRDAGRGRSSVGSGRRRRPAGVPGGQPLRERNGSHLDDTRGGRRDRPGRSPARSRSESDREREGSTKRRAQDEATADRRESPKEDHGTDRTAAGASGEPTRDTVPSVASTNERQGDGGDASTERWHSSAGTFAGAWAIAATLYGGGDTVTTVYALASGGAVETNPLVRAALDLHPGAMVAFKITILGVLFVLSRSLLARSAEVVGGRGAFATAFAVPLLLSVVGGYATTTNLGNVPGELVPYLVLSSVFVGLAGGAAALLFERSDFTLGTDNPSATDRSGATPETGR